MEEVFYKYRPYVYAVIALIALVTSKGSNIMIASSFVLMVCAAYVLKARYDYKLEMMRINYKHARKSIKF